MNVATVAWMNANAQQYYSATSAQRSEHCAHPTPHHPRAPFPVLAKYVRPSTLIYVLRGYSNIISGSRSQTHHTFHFTILVILES
jgi:hypothetical protein